LLVCSLLAIAARLAASERIFSQTERIVEARRQQLPLGSFNFIMFLRNIFSLPIMNSEYSGIDYDIHLVARV